MSNATFGFPVYSDIGGTYGPTISGGSWSASLPAVNVQDRQLQKVARSTDATAANTKLIFDLKTAQSVGLLAVFIPNITKTTTPTVQWKGGTSSGASDVYNPGAVSYWPSGITADDVISPDGTRMNVWHVLVPNAAQSARYWELDIVDTGNADGYVDVARVCICGAFTPSTNIANGDRPGIETATQRLETDGGAALYNPKRRRRTHSFSLNELTQAEAFASVRKMQRLLGTSGQLVWVPDPADTTYGYDRNFLGVMRELGPLEGNAQRYNSSWMIVEEL